MGVGVGADLRVEAEWNPSRFVGLSGTYGVDAVRFPAREQGFDAHVARVRLRAAANTHLSGKVFVQYNSVAERVTANVRLRYHLKAGTDLWLVYNEQLNADRHRTTPALPRTGRRTLLVKATYTFGL
jgi:hypothetical protein